MMLLLTQALDLHNINVVNRKKIDRWFGCDGVSYVSSVYFFFF